MFRAAEPTFKEGAQMKIKRAVSNLLILVSPEAPQRFVPEKNFKKFESFDWLKLAY